MHADVFDTLTRALGAMSTRRRVLIMMPALGMGVRALAPADSLAKKRRRKKKCKPKAKATVCAGMCGPVTTKQTCGKTVDCGPCACESACGACHVCDTASRSCVVDPTQVGQACGSSGQDCQENGDCVCTQHSCPACQQCGGDGTCSGCDGCCDGGTCIEACPSCTRCVDGQCQSCPGCCDLQGICQDGDANAACGSSGATCATCIAPDACIDGTCLCQPSTCEAQGKTCGSIGDGCGQEIACGTCSNPTPICTDNVCTACTSHSQCGDGAVCCNGRCFTGVCCDDAPCAALANAPDCLHHQCTCQANSDLPCAADLTCCQSGCADLQTNRNHCGACDAACQRDERCVAGTCASIPCTANADCPDGSLCDGGICHACTVTCPNEQTATACGASLRAALTGSAETIYVCPGTYRGGFEISRTVSVIGAGQGDDPGANTILDAFDDEQVVVIYGGFDATVSLARLRVTRGRITNAFNGAGIHHSGTSLTMTDCTVTGCVANTYGGGMASFGTLTMTGCTIRNNRTPHTPFGSGSAAGLIVSGETLLTDCRIVENQADSYGSAPLSIGGGLLVSGGHTTLAGATEVRDNTASFGGGISVQADAQLTIAETCQVTGNTATRGGGGGIYNRGVVTLEGTDPSPIVVNNCGANCWEPDSVAKCAATPVSC